MLVGLGVGHGNGAAVDDFDLMAAPGPGGAGALEKVIPALGEGGFNQSSAQGAASDAISCVVGGRQADWLAADGALAGFPGADFGGDLLAGHAWIENLAEESPENGDWGKEALPDGA